MAQQLQFSALPDMFFRISPQEQNEVDKFVDKEAAEFNLQLRNLLKRKLTQYVAWKHSTYDEMAARRRFTLDYLRQHNQVIKMYMNWVKPYIKHIERLSGEQDLLKNPRLISAFESSLVEIEVLARMRPPGKKSTCTCILLTFEYHTKPSMQYPGDAGYHRGPIHVGSTRITWRSFAWSDDQIKNYLSMRDRQDVELLASIDKSLTSAMETLGKDLGNYLEEAEKGKKEEAPPKQPLGLLDPFTAVGQGVKEAFGSLITLPKFGGKKKGEKESADEGHARRMCWIHYNIFKKAHGLLAW